MAIYASIHFPCRLCVARLATAVFLVSLPMLSLVLAGLYLLIMCVVWEQSDSSAVVLSVGGEELAAYLKTGRVQRSRVMIS